ncbi:hypothetical protein CTEN210_13032 [Chaetoceros tenuissimus]|uniref:Uncharacterized protein n=1 Tax=Chaetoceros tenuissimus TaxID=426638 RepID=A0AAD3D4E8_9STRA|nr:hypothetical protein CTEN210_13032 [Chaetoceros tenuissimus]
MKAVVILVLTFLTGSTFAFSPSSRRYAGAEKSSRSFSLLGDTMNKRNTKLFAISKNQNEESLEMNRRSAVQALISSAVIFSSVQPASAAATDIQKVFTQIEQARKQLEPVPTLIQEEKWDAVRAILITPPLSDCWSKTSKLLKNYADAIGELPDGDEFAALELKDDAEYHLRFLDMAVYNNVFNPIKTEGESGATKELVRSYYEDPKNEYNSCVKIFDALVDLKNGSN